MKLKINKSKFEKFFEENDFDNKVGIDMDTFNQIYNFSDTYNFVIPNESQSEFNWFSTSNEKQDEYLFNKDNGFYLPREILVEDLRKKT